MNFLSIKYCVRIPLNSSVLYCENKKIIVIIGALKRKCIKLKTKLQILMPEKLILIKSDLFENVSNNEKKKINSIRGTTKACLKQALVETSSILFQKLQLVGVGYRAFLIESFENQLILFKLGYSHSIYFRIPVNLQISCLKFTKIFIRGDCYQSLTQTSALIRKYRKPEPYKGKGVLYENEQVKLKIGKKF